MALPEKHSTRGLDKDKAADARRQSDSMKEKEAMKPKDKETSHQ